MNVANEYNVVIDPNRYRQRRRSIYVLLHVVNVRYLLMMNDEMFDLDYGTRMMPQNRDYSSYVTSIDD